MNTAARTRDSLSRGGVDGVRERSLPTTVLHVDDDPNDTELLRAAAHKACAPFRLQSVEDGEQAIAYLAGAGVYTDRERYPSPSLLLLDLNLPRANGWEILNWVRQHPDWGSLPVVILSGSGLSEDVNRAFKSGANSYLVKPLGFEALVTLVRELSAAWFQTPGTTKKPQ